MQGENAPGQTPFLKVYCEKIKLIRKYLELKIYPTNHQQASPIW
jgi:hypothetical protein